MQHHTDYSLEDRNTFGLKVKAKEFILIEDGDDLSKIDLGDNYYILGEGAATLFTKDFDGLIISLAPGSAVYDMSGEDMLITVPAGNSWIDLVDETMMKRYYGLQNLALIPGSVGSAVVQNIGAYGVELESLFVSLEAYDTQAGKVITLGPDECGFRYRGSIFKHEEAGRYIILCVKLKLTTRTEVVASYKSLANYLEEKGISSPTPEDVYNSVIEIRRGKLPDPSELGNNGSFFKNPVVSKEKHEELLKKHSDMPSWEVDDGIKLSAGWLIEQAGWKGYREGDVGVYENHALILVNYGEGTGEQLRGLSVKIKDDVKKKFGVELVEEVNVI